mmetsp:Transcript_27854/g.83236  ORF Transcript_27854/g.83236 Transcript_27854/m.83236 type:complete len:234 (+) Transcript_27854:643-1344(+)
MALRWRPVTAVPLARRTGLPGGLWPGVSHRRGHTCRPKPAGRWPGQRGRPLRPLHVQPRPAAVRTSLAGHRRAALGAAGSAAAGSAAVAAILPGPEHHLQGREQPHQRPPQRRHLPFGPPGLSWARVCLLVDGLAVDGGRNRAVVEPRACHGARRRGGHCGRRARRRRRPADRRCHRDAPHRRHRPCHCRGLLRDSAAPAARARLRHQRPLPLPRCPHDGGQRNAVSSSPIIL